MVYINTYRGSEIIMIILIKLLNNDLNAIINYYKIELNLYKLKIYRDITSFTLKGFVGIGMTHYNYRLSKENTCSSYFIIGISNIYTIVEEINIFKDENIINIRLEDVIIENNIFGYIAIGTRIISSLNEADLGFYIYSKNLNRKIKSNEAISFDDILNFKVSEEVGLKKDIHVLNIEVIVKEPDYSNYLSFSDLTEYYPNYNSDNNLSSFYHPEEFYGRKSYLILLIQNCYMTCDTCTNIGNFTDHLCETCSSEYPYFSNITNI